MSSAMAAEYRRLILEHDGDDVVHFEFKSEDGKTKKVTGHKSILRKVSAVFDAMFNETWTQQDISMCDMVEFDQYKMFSMFMEVIYGFSKVQNFDVNQLSCVYFYADKYQMEKMLTELRQRLTNLITPSIRKPLSVEELNNVYQMANIFSLSDLKSTIKKSKLDINDENVIEFYNECNGKDMDLLMDQVIKFLSTKKIDAEKWPLDLIIKVAERNRKELERLERLECEIKAKFQHSGDVRYVYQWNNIPPDHQWICRSTVNGFGVNGCAECKKKFNIE